MVIMSYHSINEGILFENTICSIDENSFENMKKQSICHLLHNVPGKGQIKSLGFPSQEDIERITKKDFHFSRLSLIKNNNTFSFI